MNNWNEIHGLIAYNALFTKDHTAITNYTLDLMPIIKDFADSYIGEAVPIKFEFDLD